MAAAAPINQLFQTNYDFLARMREHNDMAPGPDQEEVLCRQLITNIQAIAENVFQEKRGNEQRLFDQESAFITGEQTYSQLATQRRRVTLEKEALERERSAIDGEIQQWSARFSQAHAAMQSEFSDGSAMFRSQAFADYARPVVEAEEKVKVKTGERAAKHKEVEAKERDIAELNRNLRDADQTTASIGNTIAILTENIDTLQLMHRRVERIQGDVRQAHRQLTLASPQVIDDLEDKIRQVQRSLRRITA